MRIIATVMVRDEADVVAAMIEHHLDQGIDLIVVTDNASSDGTTEILERYATTGRVELHHDSEHRKQQRDVVTKMARRARTTHRADWVLNLDADEFAIPRSADLTVRSALEATPLHLNAFTADVVNLIGPTAESGAGFDRLVWRDQRPDDLLSRQDLHAHPTPNAVHRGESDIVVQQGNHFTSMPSNGQPEERVALEVLHLPWRSWSQFERKVVNAGRGYEASPDLRPSPKHHGMRDYRLWKDGALRDSYERRSPGFGDLEDWAARGWLARDTRLHESLIDLVDRALAPDLLRATLTD